MATPDETVTELRQILPLQNQNRILEILVIIQNAGEVLGVNLPIEGTFLGLHPATDEVVIDPDPLLIHEAAEPQGVMLLKVPPVFRWNVVQGIAGPENKHRVGFPCGP
jgi:hypothetical protein